MNMLILPQTRRKIAERRMLTLREVGERTATARDVKGFWVQVLSALTDNEFDTPFVLLYSVSDDIDSDASSLHSSSLLGSKQCYLEGSLGVPAHHAAAPEQIDLKEGTEGFGPVLREVMKTDKPVVLSIGSGDLPHEMLDGLEWRGFGDACRDVVICPIHPTTGEAILGFLVMGINPRRPYDDDYNLFVQLLSRQLRHPWLLLFFLKRRFAEVKRPRSWLQKIASIFPSSSPREHKKLEIVRLDSLVWQSTRLLVCLSQTTLAV